MATLEKFDRTSSKAPKKPTKQSKEASNEQSWWNKVRGQLTSIGQGKSPCARLEHDPNLVRDSQDIVAKKRGDVSMGTFVGASAGYLMSRDCGLVFVHSDGNVAPVRREKCPCGSWH